MMRPSFEELAAGLYVLRAPFNTIWSAVYFVRGEQNVLVDSCIDDASVDECIIPALAEIGVKPEDISYLINTHAHKDHAGGNGRFVERSGCALAAYETCADKLRHPLEYNRATRTVYPEYSPAPAAFIPANEPDMIVRDGEMLGGRLRVYHAPGHDTECIMLHDEETNTLLTGDSLQAIGAADTKELVNLTSLKNMLLTAKLIAKASLERKESRGVFYRGDYPEKNPAWNKSIVLKMR